MPTLRSSNHSIITEFPHRPRWVPNTKRNLKPAATGMCVPARCITVGRCRSRGPDADLVVQMRKTHEKICAPDFSADRHDDDACGSCGVYVGQRQGQLKDEQERSSQEASGEDKPGTANCRTRRR